jgi:hypothetical protein
MLTNKPESNRYSALKSLEGALPVVNQNVAKQQKAARDMQLQAAVAKAPASSPTTTTAQQTGSAAATQANEQGMTQAQQLIEGQAKLATAGLQMKSNEVENNLAGQQLAARDNSMDNVQRLANISESAKRDLYDKQMSFQKDEDGRMMFNERQLIDYARSNAETEEQFQNYAQTADQIHDKKIQVLEAAYAKLDEQLKFEYAKNKQDQDQGLTLKLDKMKRDMEKKIREDKTRRANNQQAWKSGGQIVGAVIGGIYGGPTGAAAGGQAGGAAGGAIGSAQG